MDIKVRLMNTVPLDVDGLVKRLETYISEEVSRAVTNWLDGLKPEIVVVTSEDAEVTIEVQGE